MKYLMVFLLCFFTSMNAMKERAIPFAYFLLLKEMLIKSSHVYKSDENKVEDKGYGEQFLDLFQESIHEGFFGGVKWGIAAAFYQVLYECSSNLITIIPQCARIMKNAGVRFVDFCCGRPSAIQLRDISILSQLLRDIMLECQDNFHDMQQISLHRRETIRYLCDHITQYLNEHIQHYINTKDTWTRFGCVVCTSSQNQIKEIEFMSTIIVYNLNTLKQIIETPSCYHEIPHVTRITLHALHTLGLFLQDADTGHQSNSVFGAWFSTGEQRKDG